MIKRLQLKERTIKRMMETGSDPDVVSRAAHTFLIKDREVLSDLYYKAMKYVAHKKFENVSNDKLREMALRVGRGKSVEGGLAILECTYRGVKLWW